NCLPAAEEYARIVGTTAGSLAPTNFAARPVVVAIDGTDYVRSIQKANPDGSLTFYCAIEEGLVLRVVRGVDLLGNLHDTFATLRAEIGPLQFVLACDCILRNLEIRQAGLTEEVAKIFRNNLAIGFSTYGEQFHGVHVNQTLSGIAIGNSETGNA
ncbi:MAG TPA: FIST C-terminal domain-containing protein, partial [Azonexus sp.]|nr:FIST C-terminal domain-containing protein [Azonexus sp.]